ncbi:TonB-dependent receptor plug domain-containing protein, partial [Sphingomonas sp. 66-10]|uniref:TonB-dependent receptor plug domain-containing protein n=1 Tax=Sphingomonas sp. 66-10 TaxID=1895848 RepID=UPI000A5A31DF
MRTKSSFLVRSTASVLAIALAAGFSCSAQAQDNVGASESGGGGDVIVTGSRIRRPADFDTSSPLVSITAQSIEQAGSTNVTDFLSRFPALQSSSLSADNAGDRGSIGTTGQNLLDLRNLGPQRTLVLINGRRHVGGVAGEGSVDINTIPSDLIERVDVLTGGESTVYGADAVSGVVNFVMKDNFEGLRTRMQAGTSRYGDAS